jgi:hypothetical protein
MESTCHIAIPINLKARRQAVASQLQMCVADERAPIAEQITSDTRVISHNTTHNYHIAKTSLILEASLQGSIIIEEHMCNLGIRVCKAAE